MAKHIAIIGTVGLPAKYGGFETLADHLVQQLENKYAFTVFCSRRYYQNQPSYYQSAKLIYSRFNANGVQSIVYDILSISRALIFADVLLILGVSGCVVLPLAKLISRKKIIVNIDGLEWKRQKWGRFAKWFLKLSEKIAVKSADEVISDNKAIQEHVRSAYGKRSHLIAYGADHVSKIELSASMLREYPFLNQPYAFSVCRIEPENNIHIILEAFSLQKNLPLVMVGNWQASEYGQALKARYAGLGHIHLLGPIYNAEKLNQIRSNCYLYVHGHSAGGTNPSLVEAMYLELPIIAYDVPYNRETTENKATYFQCSESLLEALESAEKQDLSEVAAAMKDIACRRYAWALIAAEYAKLYESIS